MSIDSAGLNTENLNNQILTSMQKEIEKENKAHQKFHSNMKEKISRLNNIITELTQENKKVLRTMRDVKTFERARGINKKFNVYKNI